MVNFIYNTPPGKRAFSLVELSIVLVILGLLVGGILSGQALIRAAELRAVSTEYQKYVTAGNSFRDKYFQIPGDMTNATQFWGAAHADPATCVTTASTSTATCNGNGDGRVNGGYSEWWHYWKHLANAGLIEGTYNGVAGASSVVDAIIGTNVPRSKLSNAGWTMANYSNFAGDSAWYAMDYGNTLAFGAKHGATGFTWGRTVSTGELWNIDTKIDDGHPARGKLIAGFWNDCTTSASLSDLTGTYALNVTGTVCGIIFRNVI